MRGWILALVGLVVVPPVARAIEVSTGFLIGPKYDPRAFYVRLRASDAWQKTNVERGFRKSAQGKLLGISAGGVSAAAPPQLGVTLIRVPLQNEELNAFTPEGRLDSGQWRDIERLLGAADRAGIIVELELFHPAKDQEFFSPDKMLDAVRHVSDRLIEGDHRNVILSFTSDWQSPGWDFGDWVPLHLERLAEAVRDQFQSRKAAFVPPIAIAVAVRMSASSSLVDTADLLVVKDEALSIDTSRIERPVLVVGQSDCERMFDRAAGCLVESAEPPSSLLSLFMERPLAPPVSQ
jgi:hypothetical protein